MVSKDIQVKWKQSLKGTSYGKSNFKQQEPEECCEGTCKKGGSTVCSFSKAQYSAAPEVKNLGTKVEAWHASHFQKWKQWFSKKIIKKQS